MARLFYMFLFVFFFASCTKSSDHLVLQNHAKFEFESFIKDNKYRASAASILDVYAENRWNSREDGRLDLFQTVRFSVLLDNNEIVTMSFYFEDGNADKSNVILEAEDPVTRIRTWRWDDGELVNDAFYHHLNKSTFSIEGLEENFSDDQLADLLVEPVIIDGVQRFIMKVLLNKKIYGNNGDDRDIAYEIKNGQLFLVF